uniref:Uncharacterized protein n=1 Tax=Anguilla anguilla TaxID=7936 RepID=A0A0E9S3B8_ANGAN
MKQSILKGQIYRYTRTHNLYMCNF